MNKLPNQIKKQLMQVYNYYRKIENLSLKLDNYFERNGLSSNDFDDGTDDLLVYLINGGVTNIDEFDEVVEKIEKIFIEKAK